MSKETMTMKHTITFLSVLVLSTACRGENHYNMGEGERPTSASVGTGSTGDDTGSGSGDGTGSDTDNVMHDMAWDTDDDNGTAWNTSDETTGDGDTTTTGDGGECDEELLAAMFACVLAGTDELDTPENICDQATPGCDYQQCTGMYYDDYHQARRDVRQSCAGQYPACAEYAQVNYYECLAGCYEDLGNCDDGTDCLSCAGDMGFCIGDCDPGPNFGDGDGDGDDGGSPCTPGTDECQCTPGGDCFSYWIDCQFGVCFGCSEIEDFTLTECLWDETAANQGCADQATFILNDCWAGTETYLCDCITTDSGCQADLFDDKFDNCADVSPDCNFVHGIEKMPCFADCHNDKVDCMAPVQFTCLEEEQAICNGAYDACIDICQL